MHSLSLSVCPCLSETLCSYFLYGQMLLHCSDMLCPNLRLNFTQQVVRVGAAALRVFLTQNTCHNLLFYHEALRMPCHNGCFVSLQLQ